LNVTGGGGDDECLDGKVMSGLRCEHNDECRKCAAIIQWLSLICRGGGGEDNCLDGSGMIQLCTLNRTCRGREDNCLDDSLMIQLRALIGTCRGV